MLDTLPVVLLTLIAAPLSGALSSRRTPVMGWSSWSVYSCNVHEDGIKAQADAIVALGLRDAGYTFIDIDDCWMAYNRSADGIQQANASLFPSGMKSLAAYLHDRGLKLGLYSDAGTATCQGRAGSLGFEQIDAHTYAEWGVDLLKYDTCNQPAGTDPKVVYPLMGRALNATGRDIWYMMCEWGRADPAEWAGSLALANSWRTGDDLMPLFPSFAEVAEGNARWWQHASPGRYNDPDTLAMGILFGQEAPLMGNTLTYSESRLYFGLWVVMKAPLVLSVDFARDAAAAQPGCSAWPRWILDLVTNREAIAINQDALSAQAHRLWSDGPGGNNTNASAVFVPAGRLEVWSGPLSNGDVAILLINKGETLATVNATFGLHAPQCGGHQMVVRDVWGQRSYGAYNVSFGLKVAPHDGELVRCSCVS
uniref:Alpha-galactosidase n=1 Tax=Haptolina ericina TaxID=156174 RepID=A0A7S3AGM9_9EUKA|mmetsp:Transcript_15779/g.35410  ORF Transcript_15779/g.35410 Transcript_15779/m.35410 type:complete len:423 (+) Transcript_15779:138-1406(+)